MLVGFDEALTDQMQILKHQNPSRAHRQAFVGYELSIDAGGFALCLRMVRGDHVELATPMSMSGMCAKPTSRCDSCICICGVDLLPGTWASS